MAASASPSALWSKTRRFLMKGHRLPICLGLLATLLTLWLFVTEQRVAAAILQRIDNLIYDTRYNLMLEAPPLAEHRIVVVDYDQKSLNIEGQWPWSRFKLGDLVRQLREYGVLVIGFDGFFPEAERNLAAELRQHLDRSPDVAEWGPRLAELTEALDGDRYFARQLAAGEVVLGLSFRSDPSVREGALPEPIIRVDEGLPRDTTVTERQGYIGNLPILQNSAAGAGFFDTTPDSDGVIRRSPLVFRFDGALYPSLALEMARLYYFEDRFTLATEPDLQGERHLTGIRMGNALIRTDTAGRVLVPYRGESRLGEAGTFPYLSATDVLRGNLSDAEAASLRNSLVLIGTTATGLFDLRATPLEAVYPGVEVHANVLDGILRTVPSVTVGGDGALTPGEAAGPFPVDPDWGAAAVLYALLGLGLILSFLMPRMGPTLLAFTGLALMAGLTALNFLLWREYRLDLPLFILLLLVLLLAAVNMGYGFLREGATRRAIKEMFDQYVPPAHIEAMLAHPEAYDFEGESKEMSVLFSDIRGFTALSETLSAGQLKTLLNDFFTPITGVIFDHQGTVDKYVGDMVMAFWGAPLDDPDHRRHAVAAALAMLDKVEDLEADFRARGLPPIRIGIGINSGMMNVGDMGSTYRRSYTVLGDAVNLGSRLEGLTKFYGVACLIGEDTHDGLQGFLCRLVDRVQVKGRELPVRLYQPLCARENASAGLRERVEQYHAAYECYLAQQWDDAEARFRELLAREPDCRLYRIYLQRIDELRGRSLPADWDGTYRHTSK